MSYIDKDGYVVITSHPCIRLHVHIAESVLGKKLPKNAIVHHIDGDKQNNKNNNLVICPSRAYHNLIHARERALIESGSANNRKCCRCGKYDLPENLSFSANQPYHKLCNAIHVRKFNKS
jgi:hypothetical protein